MRAMTEKPIPTLEIDKNNDLPLWVRLRDRVAHLISTGYYGPGDRLPTVRKLASELNISYNTVSKAYMGLERDGYITTRQGRGAFVCDNDALLDASDLDAVFEDFIKTCRQKGMNYEDIPKQINKTIRKMKRDYEKK